MSIRDKAVRALFGLALFFAVGLTLSSAATPPTPIHVIVDSARSIPVTVQNSTHPIPVAVQSPALPIPVVVQNFPLPDWTSVVTAIGTGVLALGIVIALLQFRQDRLFNRVLQTGGLIKLWSKNKYWIARSRIDKDYDQGINRQRVNRLYAGVKRFKGFKAFRELEVDVYNFIEESTRMAERMDIYISRGVADLGLIADHLGYDVLELYYCIQDVLHERALTEDLNYEGFRDLSLRIQHYARLHKDVDIRDELVWAVFPPLPYRGGDESEGYRMSRFYRWRLKLARQKFMKKTD